MFIVFNTKAQALNYIKRNKNLVYNHNEGCGCCWSTGNIFLDGNKLVQYSVSSNKGSFYASATVIGRIKKSRKE